MPATGAVSALLLDWVPGHFPTDPHGLGRFDGTALYEHADPRQGFHPDWNTLIYNYGRREVAQFPAVERASTGCANSTSTASGSMPSPRCSISTTAATRGNGSRTPSAAVKISNSIAFLAPNERACLRRGARVRLGGGGIDRLADGLAADLCRRARLWLQMDMGWMHDTFRYMSLIRSTANITTTTLFPAAYAFTREIHPAAAAMTRSCTAKVL